MGKRWGFNWPHSQLRFRLNHRLNLQANFNVRFFSNDTGEVREKRMQWEWKETETEREKKSERKGQIFKPKFLINKIKPALYNRIINYLLV